MTVYASPTGVQSGLAATPRNGQASIAFTAPESDGGAAITDYEASMARNSNHRQI